MTDWSEEFMDAPLEERLAMLKATVTMYEVVELLGLDLNAGNKISSPWNPGERTPSCHIYEDHFYDFATGKHGDMIDLVQAFEPDIGLGAVIWMLWNKALRAGREPGDVELTERSTDLVDFYDDWPNHVGWNPDGAWAERLDMRLDFPWLAIAARQRGDVIEYSQSHGSSLLIGHVDEGRIYGVKVRDWSGKKHSWPGSQFMHRLYHPYGWDPIRLGGPQCVIAEGETDALALSNHLPGVPVFALPSGAGSWRDHWKDDLLSYDTVWLCMDNDKAGQDALSKLERKVGFERARKLQVPQLINDAREALSQGWRPVLN